MKNAVTPSTEPLLELFYRGLGDPDAEVRSNSAYATGLLVEYSEVDLSPQYLPLLAALRPLFSASPDESSSELNARDNAAGAVARLLIRNSAAVPIDQVLPVFIGALPLKNDLLENRPVFRALFLIFRLNAQVLHPYMERLLQVFAYVLDPNTEEDQIDEEVKAELVSLIALLNTMDPAKVQAAGLTPFVPTQG